MKRLNLTRVTNLMNNLRKYLPKRKEVKERPYSRPLETEEDDG